MQPVSWKDSWKNAGDVSKIVVTWEISSEYKFVATFHLKKCKSSLFIDKWKWLASVYFKNWLIDYYFFLKYTSNTWYLIVNINWESRFTTHAPWSQSPGIICTFFTRYSCSRSTKSQACAPSAVIVLKYFEVKGSPSTAYWLTCLKNIL